MSQKKEFIKDIPVSFVVEIGRDEKSIEDILSWRKGKTIPLDDSTANLLNIYLNNKLYGSGSVLRKKTGEMDLEIKEKFLNEEEVKICLEEY